MNHFLMHANGPYDEEVVNYLSKTVERRGQEEMNKKVQDLMSMGLSGDDALQAVLNSEKILEQFGGQKATEKRVKKSQAEAAAKEAAKNKGYSSAEEAYSQAAKAGIQYNGPKNAAEAQSQASAASSKNASSSRTFKSAAEAQAQASAVTNKEAAKKSIALESERSKAAAANAQSSASATSAQDAADRKARSEHEAQERKNAAEYTRALMDWNNPHDTEFAEWKKKYNHDYYEAHKQEWLDPNGKYYPIHQAAMAKRAAATAKNGNATQDLAEYFDDPESKALYNAYRNMVRNQKKNGNATGMSDTELGRMFNQMVNNRTRAANSAAARALYDNRNNNVVGPSFLEELGTSAKNFGKNVKNLSSKAVSAGRNFINNLVRQIRG